MLLHHSVDLDSELSSTLTSTLAPSANWRGGAFIPKTLRMPAGVGEGGFALNGRGRKCVRGLGLGGGSKGELVLLVSFLFWSILHRFSLFSRLLRPRPVRSRCSSLVISCVRSVVRADPCDRATTLLLSSFQGAVVRFSLASPVGSSRQARMRSAPSSPASMVSPRLICTGRGAVPCWEIVDDEVRLGDTWR
ncbi:hypothetical protein DFP72DRAFT_293360 [Ephemerocybe angulata]|uniref:Uncharacterized protein n=1 Tax=Ephemerocybe angulata TaxID=980116 RepID=A0A8H6HZR5_9AGAR|nr:hypothetical protein DFP72DRAFT_293360 [Tulosesus angulatus]